MNEKVLIVDDQPEIIEAIRAALGRDRFEILGAISAGAAKKVIATEPIGVVVVDELMPGKTGSELIIELAHEYPHVPRILLTAYADFELAMKCINQGGVFKILEKPCDFKELARALTGAFELRAAATRSDRILELWREQSSMVPGSADAAQALVDGEATQAVGITQEVPAVDLPAPTDDGEEVDTATLFPGLLPDEARRLSPREREILSHLVQGKRPAQIAKLLFISVHTARNHVKAIYQKLDIHAQTELISRVLRGPAAGSASHRGRRSA